MIQFMANQVKNNLEKPESSKYKCNKCNDLTFILKDNTATPCECRSIREAERILKNSGISEEFLKMTFENYDYARSNITLEAYTLAKTYVNQFKNTLPSRNNSLLLMGQSGFGKTHLSLAVANKLMNDGVGVVYMSYRDSITYIKQSILDATNYNRELNKYKNAKVLLIDDLFKGNVTPSDINIMFEIINHRYFNNKPIIVSTEKYTQELLNIDEAIGSRILEMCKNSRLELRGKRLNHRIYG